MTIDKFIQRKVDRLISVHNIETCTEHKAFALVSEKNLLLDKSSASLIQIDKITHGKAFTLEQKSNPDGSPRNIDVNTQLAPTSYDIIAFQCKGLCVTSSVTS